MEIAVHTRYAAHVERLRWLLHECPDWGRLWPHTRIRLKRQSAFGYTVTVPVGTSDGSRVFYAHRAPAALGVKASWLTD